MAGHNKWSKVKHIKAREDAKKGKMFSKLSKEISIAARDGGGDPGMNPRLRAAIDAAKSNSMPKENIERAVKKGTGELGGDAIEEVTYEGYAPGGIAVLVEVSTDNKNRSAADIRSLFNKGNGNLGSSGSVAYLFQRKGEIRVPGAEASEEEMLEKALEAGADDVEWDEDEREHVVRSAPEDLMKVAQRLRDEGGVAARSQELVYLPDTTITIEDPSLATQVLRLYEALDDYDDTLNVFSNFEIAEGILDQVLVES